VCGSLCSFVCKNPMWHTGIGGCKIWVLHRILIEFILFDYIWRKYMQLFTTCDGTSNLKVLSSCHMLRKPMSIFIKR
jgi:hypothetical protein